jgi:predicted metal-dependent HD superfamily phosphohydrolase
VLAADAAVYQAYVDGVRSEYAHVADDQWLVGRAAVLRRFLDRPAIFHTAGYAPREAQARANLTAELAALDR